MTPQLPLDTVELQHIIATTLFLLSLIWDARSQGEEKTDAQAGEKPEKAAKRLLADKRFRQAVSTLSAKLVEVVYWAVTT